MTREKPVSNRTKGGGSSLVGNNVLLEILSLRHFPMKPNPTDLPITTLGDISEVETLFTESDAHN